MNKITKLLLLLLIEFVIAVILTIIQKKQGSIYHTPFWEQVLVNLGVMFLGGAPVLLFLSKE